jgi:hypothetical protein
LRCTGVSAFGESWRWEAPGGKDHKEGWGPLDRKEDEELGLPICGVHGSVDTPVVPEEKVRVDEKLGRGGDNWNADPSSADASEPGGVKAPNMLGRLKAHGPWDFGEEAGSGVFRGLCSGCGGAREASVVRPW